MRDTFGVKMQEKKNKQKMIQCVKCSLAEMKRHFHLNSKIPKVKNERKKKK